MSTFSLDHRLANDCYTLGSIGDTELLLMDNALFPWLILVPHTEYTEFYELDDSRQQALLDSVNRLSVFIKQHFNSEKLNIATIGNIVSQLHIHVVGRSRDDVCWPGVVWGTRERRRYSADEVSRISTAVGSHLGECFLPRTR